jgi:hypothetical protein
VGGIGGAVGYYASGVQVDLFGNDTGLGGTLNYIVNSAAHGAVWGGAYAAVMRTDIGEGVLSSGEWGAIGATANLAVGHLWGLTATGTAPRWDAEHRVYVYYRSDDHAGAITFGNVVTGGKTRLEDPTDTSRVDSSQRFKTVIDHEAAHVQQSYDLGSGYMPAHVASMVAGTLIGGMAENSEHAYGFLEKYWIEVPY